MKDYPGGRVDLRSDTVTQPTPEMRKVMSLADVGDDVLGDDPNVNQLEKIIAEMLNKEAALFVPSGTMSNAIAIRAHTNPGDEIIVPANTFIASIIAITENNLKPIFVEPDILNFNLDLDKIKEKITKKTKGIMIVHLYGRVCRDESLLKLKIVTSTKLKPSGLCAVIIRSPFKLLSFIQRPLLLKVTK